MDDPTASRPTTPEERARINIDRMLQESGWVLRTARQYKANPSEVTSAGRGVAVEEFLLNNNEEADYLLFVDGAAVGVIEAKQEGTTLTGVEHQSAAYADGVPDSLTVPIRPLPFLYESTGVETCFTNCLDPEPRSREVFAVHRPETLAAWIADQESEPRRPTLREGLRSLPPIDDSGLWKAQRRALRGLEGSLMTDRPRSLIQMATGAGKTYVAANSAWRLVRHGGARRVLFLVDRSNLGIQAEGEFERFRVPGDGRKFTELYTVQRLTRNRINTNARVVISTVQRLYSMLKGEDSFDDELDEHSPDASVEDSAVKVRYNPELPPETFDVIFVDECHRSIYGLWSQVLAYFDAHIIGLTATPSKQALGFFDQNLVCTYSHEEAVADKVNVNFDVYEIKTEISEEGATVDEGTWAAFRDRATRRKRWEELEEDIVYGSDELDRAVVAEDQIRTVIRHFRDVYATDLFPGRPVVPKTLIFAKDDSHADDIVRIVREEFGRGNDFCVKITYRTTGKTPDELLQEFRTSTLPRIVVSVDMISTGTDVKPLECLIFMRSVKSPIYFEQMKGRGVRVISDAALQAVSPGAITKDRFILIDAVGVTESEMTESLPLERKRSATLAELMEQLVGGSREPALVSSIGVRLMRLERKLRQTDRDELAELAGGQGLAELAGNLIRAVDIDAAYKDAEAAAGSPPTDKQVEEARQTAIRGAVQVLLDRPPLRSRILEMRAVEEQLIDSVTPDAVVESGFSIDAKTRAKKTISDWEQFIEDNKDELTALQILYSKPYGKRLTFAEVRELAKAIERPPHAWTPEHIWTAYETLEESRVRRHGGKVLTDLVSLVRYTLEHDSELVPWTETIDERFNGWIQEQQQAGRTFTSEQEAWLRQIKDHIAGSLNIQAMDLTAAPFTQHGGLGRAREVFGGEDQLDRVLEELSAVLVA